MSLMQQMLQQLSGPALNNLCQQLGIDEQTASRAISAAVPMLIGALARNASNPGGAQALNNALERDHDGSILNNLTGFLGSTDNGSGPGILRHVFGGNQGMAQQGIGRASGLDPQTAGRLMENLAPVVMGMLGQQRQQSGLDAGALAQMLGGEVRSTQGSPMGSVAGNLISGMLDQNNDGSALDDVAGMLGRFLGGR